MLVDFGSLSGSHNTEGFLFSNRFPLGLELFFFYKNNGLDFQLTNQHRYATAHSALKRLMNQSKT